MNLDTPPKDDIKEQLSNPDEDPADIIAVSLLHPERSTKLGRTTIKSFRAGGQEPKAIIESRIGDHEVSLVGRPYDKHYFKIWQEFRNAGLPVVPTLREGEVNGQQSLLMTDLKADGSELYGRGLKKTVDPSRRHRLPAPGVDDLFLRLTEPSNFTAIEGRARELANIATKNGLELPFDDPFELRVSPDGSWQLITIDLAFARKPTDENDIHEIEWTNAEHIDDFLEQLQKLRARLIELNTSAQDIDE